MHEWVDWVERERERDICFHGYCGCFVYEMSMHVWRYAEILDMSPQREGKRNTLTQQRSLPFEYEQLYPEEAVVIEVNGLLKIAYIKDGRLSE